jgi:hypothetical protein
MRIERHYQEAWNASGEVCSFSQGPVDELPDGFAVLRFPPRESRGMWTYATCGMSEPSDERAVELHMFSLSPTAEIVELLYATAHFHRTSTSLRLGDSVNFGRPWVTGSLCSYGLVSLPYLDGPSLENLQVDSSLIKFYWLVPVTGSEVEFKKSNGLDALEVQFEHAMFNYADPMRLSVI